MAWPQRGLRPLVCSLVLAWLGVASFAAPASAHEGEEEVPARTQVAVADALLRTQPEQMDLAADRNNDALEAEDHEGVDLGRVKQAKDTLDAGDTAKTELLLEQALGACPGQPVVNPTGVRAKLPQTPCPTPAHELALGRVPLHGTAAGPADRRRGAGAGRPCDGLEDPMSDATIDRGATRPAPPIPWRRRALDALDERLGLKGLQYPIPAHANTLAYSLGGLALISFVLMVASGIFLTQYYNPDPALAHASVRHIITGVTGGDFIRAFHYWGAMAMIVLIGLHLLRVFASASFKRPREGNWVIGVALAGITAGLFFSGSVLKWDQESLEALEHNIEVGKLLGRFGFWFSDTFGGLALLTRLYVVHISILPALFTLAVVVHLLLVKRHGMAPSPFRREA